MDILQKIMESDFLTERRKKILEMRLQGKTLEQIGQNFNITRERVRQIGQNINKKIAKNLTKEELKSYEKAVLENKQKVKKLIEK